MIFKDKQIYSVYPFITMIEAHLYGTLRQFGRCPATAPCIIHVVQEGSVEDILGSIGIPLEEVSSIFINGIYRYDALRRDIKDGDRLGIFPKNMSMLYV
jgi:hypothetical protein